MVYESYRYDVQSDGLHIMFSFRLSEQIVFRPTAVVEVRPFLRFDLPSSLLDRLVFHIGMIELISYWKCACPPQVVVQCGTLDETQIRFWKKLYYNGLGEFFWLNGIRATQDDFMSLRCEVAETTATARPAPCDLSQEPVLQQDSYLVPIGGGKDSVVTLEALKTQGSVRPLIMNPRGATILCAERGGFPLEEVVVLRRSIDPLLLELNGKGMLNGHTPFSAMLAFYTLLAGACSGYANIALSNESSANESTVVGTSVNHQYSKSLEFEDDFRRYVQGYMSLPLRYFSFLRPLSELQIAMLFARCEQYHDVFKSCNAGSKQDVWCCHCAKCLFAFIILSPFVEPARLAQIFGSNLLDDATLQHEFDQLTGRAETKPFECVGTISEVHAALAMAMKRYYRTGLPALLREYRPQPVEMSLATLLPDHNLTTEEAAVLQNWIVRPDEPSLPMAASAKRTDKYHV